MLTGHSSCVLFPVNIIQTTIATGKAKIAYNGVIYKHIKAHAK